MNKKLVLIGLLICFCMVPVVYGRVPTNVTVIVEDGDITNAFVKDNTSLVITCTTAGGIDDRGYIEYNISGIPDTAIIDSVNFTSYKSNFGNYTTYQMDHQPSVSTNTRIWNDAANGTAYATTAIRAFGYITQPLVGAAADLQANLAADWFAVGLNGIDFAVVCEVASSQSANDSYITVRWHLPGDTRYIFNGVFFENANKTGAVTVTAAIAAGNEEFVVNGEITQYFPVEPLIFYWDLGGGDTRRIYSIGAENLTVTLPDMAFDTYTFTVRDFTNKLSKGDAYLEAWRIVGLNDTLIERQIIDVHNEVPLNLVIGATYTLRVRFYDNSTFDWGFFVPGQTLTNTIVLRGVEITDQAYQIGNFISVEITRPIATQLTVDYLASKNQTIWSNVTIVIRNGAQVAFTSRTNNSYTFNYLGAVANTSYTVLVNGEHTLQTAWSYSKTFDAQETYPAVPNVENIFPMGTLDATNMIAWTMTLVAGVSFSVIYRRASLIVMCSVASFFTAFGFTDWNFYLLSVGWFFAIMVYLGGGDR